MRILSAWAVVFLGIGLAAGCKPGPAEEAAAGVEVGAEAQPEAPEPARPEAPEPAAPAAAPPVTVLEETTLEADSFKLEGAEVKSLAGASGGTAVLFAKEGARAEVSVKLEKGTYEVIVYTQGADDRHDAFYVSLAGVEQRRFPSEWGKVLAAKAVTVSIESAGDQTLVIRAAESGVHIDRVVLKRVK